MRLLLTLLALLGFAGVASAQTGTISANGQCRSIDTDNKGQGTLEVSGTWTGTLTWYVSNGVARAAVDLGTPAAPGTAVNSTTANGHWYGNVGGWRTFEVCATATWTGTATVWLNATNAGSPLVFAAGGGGAGTSDTTEATQLLVLAAVDGLETNTAAGLTSANFAAAFGTAGTADAQVLSVQGIASMTPLSSNLFVGGSAVATGAGATGATVPRVDLANDGDVAVDINDIAGNMATAAAKLTNIDSRLVDVATLGQTSKTQGDQPMFHADSSAPAAVVAGQAQRPWVDLNGRIQTNLSQMGGTATPIVTATLGDDLANTQDGLAVINLAYLFDGTTWDRAPGNSVTGAFVGGAIGHDIPDTGNPVKVGGRAVSFGATPTAVAAADRFDFLGTRAGIPFVQPGHPNAIPFECQVEDADGALTNQACVTVSAGTKIVVTAVDVNCDGSTTNPTNIVVGFGTATLPARAHTGAAGILLAFDGVPAGGGKNKGNGAGIVGVGADDEDIRYTIEDPVGGSCSISGTYYTIAG